MEGLKQRGRFMSTLHVRISRVARRNRERG